ncbi:hypothetical protein FACS1894190_09760 [Spirochaetia bacterium]|nr:hypothetical protein FACS1894190_09760 [Spirochaetia bacterium]
MIFLLAVKNIVRNKKNSFIVILLIGIITALFFIGNSVILSSSIGLRESYTKSLTGDVIIEKSGDVSMNLFGANAPIIDDFFSIPPLPAYNYIEQALNGVEEIEAYTSQVSSAAAVEFYNYRAKALLCGVDASSYFSLFPDIILQEGHFLKNGESGAMITLLRAQQISEVTGRTIKPGDILTFLSGSSNGFRIREVPIAGIFDYRNPGDFMDEIVIMDAQTVRILAEIQVAAHTASGVDTQPLLESSGDIDDLFLNSEYINEEDEYGSDLASELQTFLSNNMLVDETDASGGDWNFIIIKLKNNTNTTAVINKINKIVNNFDATAVGWRQAAGASAIIVLVLQSLFNAGVFLVSVTGVIAIINIMLIAVFKRAREIGTLCAIGASDFYIRMLILTENLITGFLAGIFGLVAGFVLLSAVNSLQISINNNLIAGLLGARVLSIKILPQTALLSFLLAELVSLLASVYPVETAVRIEPITALRRG